MNLISILFFIAFLLIILSINYLYNRFIENELSRSNEKIINKTVYVKSDISCEIYASGGGSAGWNYRFRKCDLKFLDDALLIYGYWKIGNMKMHQAHIVLTKNMEFYSGIFSRSKIIYPKILTLNSYNNDIFIEFGESNFSDVNVQIRLKKITEEEKKYIRI